MLVILNFIILSLDSETRRRIVSGRHFRSYVSARSASLAAMGAPSDVCVVLCPMDDGDYDIRDLKVACYFYFPPSPRGLCQLAQSVCS